MNEAGRPRKLVEHAWETIRAADGVLEAQIEKAPGAGPRRCLEDATALWYMADPRDGSGRWAQALFRSAWPISRSRGTCVGPLS